MDIKEAKRLSILKWEWIVKRGGDKYSAEEINDELPELRHLLFNCGFCQISGLDEFLRPNCNICPLMLNEKRKSDVPILTKPCIPQFVYWIQKVEFSRDLGPCLELAVNVLNAIKDVPDEEV